jgi:hypothetical protein
MWVDFYTLDIIRNSLISQFSLGVLSIKIKHINFDEKNLEETCKKLNIS